MPAIRVTLVSLAAVALCLHGSAAQSTADSSAAGASTISNMISNLVSGFASTQAQTQTGLASQLFGMTSASKSSPYLTGTTSDNSALGSALSSLSSSFGGASSGSGLASYLSPMTIPKISVQGLDISPEIMDLQTAEAAFENFTSPYCSDNFFNKSQEIPAVLNGPSLTVTLTTGTCAIVKDKTDEGKNDLLEGSLTCVGPELSYEKLPAVFVSNYKSAASFSTKSCQLFKNITSGFSKVLYSGGDDVTYDSVKDFMTALTNGDFVLGMTPSQQFVQVAAVPAMSPAASAAAAASTATSSPASMPDAATPITAAPAVGTAA